MNESDDGKTMPDLGPAPRVGAIAVEDATAASGSYAFGAVLGRGGMGEVVSAHDRRIGRDVALKRLRGDAPTRDDVARFIREAQIQARLEHPAIVPVYEIGRDQSGLPYFTMKRLAGATLDDKIERESPQRLLRAFVEVCRAVDYAHSKGVVHRDLKPANIVLGEFGEVYVLDWGVARVLDDTAVATKDEDTMEGSQPPATFVGTAGHIAPEQVANAEVGRAADIYALGTLLFQILTGERVHPKGAQAALASTLGTTTVLSPATRRPERQIAPELDALCTTMLARSPRQRPTARVCAEQIDAYLDGDRDLAQRKTLARELVWQARSALDVGRRDDAMRSAGRALALDATTDGAAELITTLMLQPPQTAPASLTAAQRGSDLADISRHAKSAIPGYLVMIAFLPVLISNGVHAWLPVLAYGAVAAALAFAAYRLMQRPHRSFAWMVVYALGNSLVLALVGQLAGELMFAPALVVLITASLVTYPAFVTRRWVLIGIMLAGYVVPLLLESTNVLPRTWTAQSGGVLVHGHAMEMSGTAAVWTVILGSLATILMAGIQSSTLGRASRDAHHRLVAQAWHLNQLLPANARAETHG